MSRTWWMVWILLVTVFSPLPGHGASGRLEEVKLAKGRLLIHDGHGQNDSGFQGFAIMPATLVRDSDGKVVAKSTLCRGARIDFDTGGRQLPSGLTYITEIRMRDNSSCLSRPPH